MTKLVIFLAIYLNSNFSNAQNVNLAEMIKICSMSFEKFDTYIQNKGYEFEKVDKTEAYESRSYVYKRNKQNGKYATSFMHIYKYNNGQQMVTWEIVDQNQYLKMKNQIKTNGFIFSQIYSNEGAAFIEYIKGKLKATLVSDIGKTSSGETLTNYEIGITISSR